MCISRWLFLAVVVLITPTDANCIPASTVWQVLNPPNHVHDLGLTSTPACAIIAPMRTIHSTLGYLLIGIAAVGLLWNGYRYARGQPASGHDRTLNTWFLVGLYAELLLGLLLFMLSSGFLPSPIHPLLGLGALAVAQWGLRPRLITEGRGPGFQALVYLSAGVLVVLGVVL